MDVINDFNMQNACFGSRIIADMSRGYLNISNTRYEHDMVNYTVHFIDLIHPFMHKHNIERLRETKGVYSEEYGLMDLYKYIKFLIRT